MRLAWKHEPFAESSLPVSVAGAPTASYLQVMVKNSRTYAGTGGWGFAEFNKDGEPADAAKQKTCFPCHAPAKARDFVFTQYAP